MTKLPLTVKNDDVKSDEGCGSGQVVIGGSGQLGKKIIIIQEHFHLYHVILSVCTKATNKIMTFYN